MPHGGADHAGAEGVDADAVRGEFQGEGLGDADYRELGAAVGGHARGAALAGDGCRVHDGGIVGGAQCAQGGAGHQEDALGVHGEDLVPLRFAELLDWAAVHHAGVVDQHVQAAEGVHGRLHRCRARFRVGDVERRAAHVAETAEAAHRVLHLRLRAQLVAPAPAGRQVGDHHLVPCLQKALGNALADAASAARDQNRSRHDSPLQHAKSRTCLAQTHALAGLPRQ